MNKESMNILAIDAHPDDIEYGCAGSLVKYRQQGHRIFLLVVTNGACKGDSKIRKQEQLEAARIMDAEDVFFGDYPDTQLTCGRELIMFIEDIARKVQPDFAFVPSRRTHIRTTEPWRKPRYLPAGRSSRTCSITMACPRRTSHQAFLWI